MEPLGVAHVGLASPGDAGGLFGIDKADFKPAGFEDLERWDPIDAGAFHRHGFDAALGEPVGERVQLIGEAAEGAHTERPGGRAVGRHGDDEFARTDVDACRVAAQVRLKGSDSGGFSAFQRCVFLMCMGVGTPGGPAAVR